MTPTLSPNLGHINELLAARGYEVAPSAPDGITIKELDSGVSIQAVLEGDILFLTLPCITVPRSAVTPEIMATLVKRMGHLNIHAYYVYVHDLVTGVEDLRTTVDTAIFIEKHVRGSTAGFNTQTCASVVVAAAARVNARLRGAKE